MTGVSSEITPLFTYISNVNCQGVVKQKWNEFSDSNSNESSEPGPFVMGTSIFILV